MTKKKGRPFGGEIDIDWELVKRLATIQCTRDEIAAAIDIDRRNLQRKCEKEFGCTFGEKLEEWRVGGKASLRRKQWLLADKNAAMAIFLGKQVLGQRDDIRLNHQGTVVQEIVHFGDGEPKRWEDEQEKEE